MDSEEAERRDALDRAVPGTVELERHAPAIAIMTLRGEHDLSTRAAIADALTRAGDDSHVLVDLSECSFIDSTVIGTLVLAFQAFDEQGRRLELAIPPGATTVQRVAKVAGLSAFFAIHETRSAGLESIAGS